MSNDKGKPAVKETWQPMPKEEWFYNNRRIDWGKMAIGTGITIAGFAICGTACYLGNKAMNNGYSFGTELNVDTKLGSANWSFDANKNS